MLHQTQRNFAEDSRYYQVRIIMFHETLPDIFFLIGINHWSRGGI